MKHMKIKLQPFRQTWVETLFPVADAGYVYSSDGFSARYLPGRNVVIVEAASLDGLQSVVKVCQVADFNDGMAKLPGQNEPGMMGIWGRGVEGLFAVEKLLNGVVIKAEDRR